MSNSNSLTVWGERYSLSVACRQRGWVAELCSEARNTVKLVR